MYIYDRQWWHQKGARWHEHERNADPIWHYGQKNQKPRQHQRFLQ